MRWPGVAIDAAVLATPIGIDRSVETDIRAVVCRDDVARALDAHLGLECFELSQASPAVVEVLPYLSLKAAGPVRARTAAAAAFFLDESTGCYLNTALGGVRHREHYPTFGSCGQ